jgi:hypothetical protein
VLKHSRRHVLLAGVVTSAVVAPSVAVGVAIAAPSADPVRTTVLHGEVLPDLMEAKQLGATRPDRRVEVGITLARPHPAAEAAYKKALYTKGSGNYHHFLTPTQFDARFGVAKATYDAVASWATRSGLTVAAAPLSHDYLLLAGTAAQASETFNVTLRTFKDRSGKYFANINPPTVPAVAPITGVIGLNSKLRSTPLATKPVATLRSGVVIPAQDTCAAGTCTGLTTPQDMWSVYNQPTDNYGQGQRMAIFGEGETDPVISNLRAFEKLHGLPPIPIDVVKADGPDADYSDNSGEVEWDLDTQSSTGMAPKAYGETLYFGTSLTDASVLNVFNAWADDANGPMQASASYGECEENPVGNASEPGYAFSAGVAYTVASEAALSKAVMEGRTLFASTGDTGSSCPVVPVNVNGVGNEAFPVVNYPASSPNVVAVGGTVLYTDKDTADETADITPSGATRTDEYSWNYTGGGTSVTFAKPSYQKGVATITGYCVQDDTGTPAVPLSTPCRGIPDIAAQSGDVAGNGYAIVAGGETAYPGGGTSLSSPMSLGMWTRIQAAAASKVVGGKTTYPGLGFANPVFYSDAAAHPADFFDIGAGTNGSQPNSNGVYASAPGWDYLSGLGTLDVSAISTHVNGGTAPSNPILPDYPEGSGGPTLDPCAAYLFTDATRDDAYIGDTAAGGSNPQLDIFAGKITNDGTTLHTTIVITDLNKDMANAAGAANDYYFLWTYKDVQYFTEAEVDTTTGDATYHDGTISGNQFTTANDDTGSFTAGKAGRLVVDVPLANIGSPATGDDLLSPAVQTRVLVGTAATGGFIEQADVGGPKNDYEIGQVCTGVPSPTPTPTVTPTVTPTPTPTPTPTKASGDHRAPKYSFKVTKRRKHHHRRRIIIRVTDGGSGIAFRGAIDVRHGVLVHPQSASARTYKPVRSHIRLRAHRLSHRHKTLIKFTVKDAAGNVSHIRKRF